MRTVMFMRFLLKSEKSIRGCDLMRVLLFGDEIFQAWAIPF